jgi:hypothetical protein
VTDRSPLPRILRLLNLALLVVAYAVALVHRGMSQAYVLTLLAGAAVIVVVALLAFNARRREAFLAFRDRYTGSVTRGAAAVLPWLGLFAVVAAKGLWWTQRPPALRFFITWVLLNWSIGWCVPKAGLDANSSGANRAVLWIGVLLGALGLNGLGFGVAPFGCALSALCAATAAFALAVACLASPRASLKLFAASAATALAVAGVEAAVRLLDLGHNVQEVDSRELARQFYSLTPPGTAFLNSPNVLDEYGPALIEINSLGIRGPEIPENRADVLLLGDSMIEARQLPWDRTVSARLQQVFRDRAIPVRVVGHGMRGWSPLLEWNWYLKVGRQLRARTVLLFFFWNDLWTAGDEATTYQAVLTADGRPEYFDVPVDSNRIWYKNVRVIRLAADVWHRLSVTEIRRAFSAIAARQTSTGTLDTAGAQRLARDLTEPPLTPDEQRALLTQRQHDLHPPLHGLVQQSFWPRIRPWHLWTDEQRAAAAATELKIQRFAEDVAADGARLVLVHVPNPLQIGPAECAIGRLFERFPADAVLPPDSGIQTWLRGVTGRHHIELIDPSAAMRDAARQSGFEDPLYLRADCHWSPRGHQFMADYLADWYLRGAAGRQQNPDHHGQQQ